MNLFLSLFVLTLLQGINARVKEATSTTVLTTVFIPTENCTLDGLKCDLTSTCNTCCNSFSYSEEDNTFLCGVPPCLVDGTDCGDDDNCWQCCSGPYGLNSTTCGGTCLEYGTKCDEDECYNMCCNFTSWYNEDHNECGVMPCIEDGKACIPGETCYNCCKGGAYDDSGYTCGGDCMEDGTECEYGEDCHLCCNWYSYWYSKEKNSCGYEPCIEDGKDCIPGESCNMCCTKALDNDGTTCGGTCIPDDTVCKLFGTCEKCCNGNYFWDKESDNLKCGYKACLEDNTSCTPGYDCHNCCNGAYEDNGSTCGGTCLEQGTKCDYYTTCNQCCSGWGSYSKEESSHICQSYMD